MSPTLRSFVHRSRFATLSLAGALTLAACAGDAAEAPPAVDATLYEGARIVQGNGNVIEDGAFVVQEGRIMQVGRRGDVTFEGATVVDLTGRTVMPALVNTHVHLGETREALTEELQHFAYYGVGTVQSLGLDSASAAFEMRGESVPGGARYLTAGAGITAPEPGRSEVPHWVTTEEEARAAVRALAEQDLDLMKIWVDDRNGQYEKLSEPLYTAVIAEAHAQGSKVAAHIFALEDAKGLLRAGIDAFAHSVRDTDVDDEIMALLAERPDFTLIPNLPDRGVATDLSFLSGTIPADQLAQMQERATDRPEVQERFAVQGRNLARMNAAGVRIAMGTDGGTPHAAHLEIEDMVGAGMTPAEAIVAATATGAAFLGLADVGTIEAGKVADFLVLEANPLDDITNTRRIASVFLRGEEVDRTAVSSRILAAAATENTP